MRKLINNKRINQTALICSNTKKLDKCVFWVNEMGEICIAGDFVLYLSVSENKIYLTFLHCVLSNVCSEHLDQSMHSHICYICLTFLHCAFSNDFSNCLHERMQSYTGCIYLTFLHCTVYSCTAVCFQKGSQIACMKRCIVTLIAYIWHFSAVCFQMSAQTARMGRCKVTLFTLVWLVFTVPLYMSSQRDWLRAPLWLFSRVCIYSHWISYTDHCFEVQYLHPSPASG